MSDDKEIANAIRYLGSSIMRAGGDISWAILIATVIHILVAWLLP